MLSIRHACTGLTFWIVLAFIALLASPPALAACDVAGDWRQSTTNVGQSTWTLTPQSGNFYRAQERGLGNATGTATVSGTGLTILWRTGGHSGTYGWTLDASCSSGHGSLIYSRGATGTHASSVQRVGSSGQAHSPDAARSPGGAHSPDAARSPGGMHSPDGTHSDGYWARWVAGGTWVTPWTWYDASYVAYYRAPVCGHGVACSCRGRDYCGAYYLGSTAPFWGRGCNRDPIMVRCEVYK